MKMTDAEMDAMVEQIIDRAGRESSMDGMDGDRWDRILVRAALTARLAADQQKGAMLAFAPKPEAQAVERRAPVQRYGQRTIPWRVHCLAWEGYAKEYGTQQSAERLAERGGFGTGEMDKFLPGWRDMAHAIDHPAPASHDAQDGDHWSEFVVIERHWLQNIASAVCLLEQSESLLDRREGAALRKLVASARSTPKPEAAAPTEPHSAYALRLLVAGRFVSQSKVDDAMKIARDLLPAAAGALTPAATPGEKQVKCRRCMDTQQEFNYNGDGPFPCRHCYDAQKEGNGNG